MSPSRTFIAPVSPSRYLRALSPPFQHPPPPVDLRASPFLPPCSASCSGAPPWAAPAGSAATIRSRTSFFRILPAAVRGKSTTVRTCLGPEMLRESPLAQEPGERIHPGGRLARHLDDRADPFPQALVRIAHHRHRPNPGKSGDGVLDGDRRDVHPAPDDEVLHAPGDPDVTVFVDAREIAGAEEPVRGQQRFVQGNPGRSSRRTPPGRASRARPRRRAASVRRDRRWSGARAREGRSPPLPASSRGGCRRCRS